MSSSTIEELPAPPPGNTGWPWTEQSDPLPETIDDGTPWPKISIVTPSYNQGQFIEETIRSVLLQGYPNLEYIVIDGGSTDESVQVIEKYDPWIDHWVSEPDEGQSDAINKGLKKCTGIIWNWINSDDLLAKEALQSIGRNMGDCDALIGTGWVFDEHEKHLRRTDNFSTMKLVQGYDGCSFLQQAVWLRTEQVKACGGVDVSFEYAMDRDLYVRYTYEYPDVKYIDQSLANFRYQESSKSATSENDFFEDHISIAQKVLASEMHHPGLQDLCRQVIKKRSWRIFVDDLRNRRGEARLMRIAKIVWGILKAPRWRLNRYALGAIRRIIR